MPSVHALDAGRGPDRRTDSNPEKDGGQVSSSESLPGRRRLTEEVAHKRRLGMSYRTTDARWRRTRRKKRAKDRAKVDTENPTETKAFTSGLPVRFSNRAHRSVAAAPTRRQSRWPEPPKMPAQAPNLLALFPRK